MATVQLVGRARAKVKFLKSQIAGARVEAKYLTNQLSK